MKKKVRKREPRKQTGRYWRLQKMASIGSQGSGTISGCGLAGLGVALLEEVCFWLGLGLRCSSQV